MFKKNSFLGFWVYSLCAVSFYCCILINAKILEDFFAYEHLSFYDYDHIEFLKMLGYVLASAIIVLFTSILSFYRVVLIAMPLNFLCCFFIILFELDDAIMTLSLIVYGATSMMMVLLFIDKMFELRRSKKLNLVILLPAEMLISYIIIVYFNLYNIDEVFEDLDMIYIFKANIIPLFVFCLMVFSFKRFRSKRDNEGYNFNIVIRNMELESLMAFVVFFTLMSIRNGYEVFSLSHQMHSVSSETIRFICFSAIVIPVILFKFFLSKRNIYKTNITSLVCLILLFLLLSVLGQDSMFLIINLMFIGVSIMLFFIGNIFILSRKFEGINFTSALAIYALAASMGYYCGYITIDTSEETLGPNGFLISICFVLTSLLLYYLYLFKKLKLYR